MYTQGNHNPQPRQDPPNPISSPYQQLPPGPPTRLPQFQQGPVGFTPYQHGPAAPHQIQPGGLPNTGQSYLHPPVHVHTGAPMPHMYPTYLQNSQHHLHLGTQNAHDMPQPVLPPPSSASYPEVSQAQPPFRVLPPPPPQSHGKIYYTAAGNAQPQQLGLQHITSHPPLPPTSSFFSFFTSAPLGSFVQPTGGDHHVPFTSSLPPPPPLPPNLPSTTSLPPPPPLPPNLPSTSSLPPPPHLPPNLPSTTSLPPPPLPPPLPSASPLPPPPPLPPNLLSTSSLPSPVTLLPSLPSPLSSTSTVFSSSTVQYISNLPCNLDSDGLKLSASGPVDKNVAQNQVNHNSVTDNNSLNMSGGNGCNMGSLVRDKLSLHNDLTLDLSSTPPKPTDENVIQMIEALCQSIAKNGPDYEDMVRKNESGKPDYAFLNGGEPGSEAAIAHVFFQWMKNRSIVSCKSDEQQRVSSLRPSEQESPEQPCHFVTAASHLPDDSDMEMEDDITQTDDNQGMNQSLEGFKSHCDIRDGMLNVEEQLHPPEILTESNAFKSILSEKISAAGSSRLGEQDQEGITSFDQLAVEASVSEVSPVKLTVPTKQPIVSSLEKSNTSSQLAKGGSPFGLLRDYGSDDNSEKDIGTGVENRNAPFAANLGGDFGSRLENASSICLTEKGFGPVSNMPYNVERTSTTSITNGNEHVDNKHIRNVSANHVANVEVLQKENIIDGVNVENVKLSQERRKEEENLTLGSQQKVDRFGRLVRNGGCDSDSDDLDYIGRHRRGRTRSRSQSRSPPDRRKRGSPRRRRKKRSLSHSWSPRNRRSRSRSPRNRRSRSRSPRNRRSRSRSPRNRRSRSKSPRNRRSRSRSPYLHRADEFGGENKRRVEGQMQICFDFRRGKCYRGVFCRFLHHDSGKSDESRRERSKQQHVEFPHISRVNVRDEIKLISEKAVDHEHGEIRGPELKPYGSFVTSRDRNTNLNREDSVSGGIHKQDSQSSDYHIVKSEESRDIPASVFETHLVENMKEKPNLFTNENCDEAALESHCPLTVDAVSVDDIHNLNSCAHASQKILISFKKSADQKSLFRSLDPVRQNANYLPQQSGNSSILDSSHKTSASSPNRLREGNSHPNTTELHNHPSHIDNPEMKQLQTASSMFHSSGESFPSYTLPDQQSYFAVHPKSSLASLPSPPPLTPQDSTKIPIVSSHFQQSHLLFGNGFCSQINSRPYPTELPAHSQTDGFQQRAFIPMQEANQTFMLSPLPVCNLPIQQLGAPSISGDDGLTHPPTQNAIASSSFARDKTYPHTMPVSQQLLGNTMQSFPSKSLPPGALSNSYIHPYPQQQQPQHGLHHPMADRIYNIVVKMNSSLEDPSCIKDSTSHRIDIRGSISSTFPNPYAPTLEQPMNSQYHSHVLQEKGTTYNNTPFSFTRASVDGKGIRLQQETSSLNSTSTFGQNIPRAGGDQYDPLFDSFEPPIRLSRKNDSMEKLEVTGDSGLLLGPSDSYKPLNMEEKSKDAGAITSAASADNEEFGETADAEVGTVENGSPSHPVEVNMATSEIEMDQIKSPGKSKKSKDSRSMKHFKVAIAKFVKEVLKPSWQQGNMSKEAFKTIVKKTVDKVSGAKKNHQIPKSRAKIDHYIESSQRKLTKLVMGYVDKYVKA